MGVERAVEICMEQARAAIRRSEEFRIKHGVLHIGAVVHGDRGAMGYQCACAIAKEFGLAEPEFGEIGDQG